MKKLVWLVVLAVLVGGCQSLTHPPAEKDEAPAFNSQAPDGNASPFR